MIKKIFSTVVILLISACVDKNNNTNSVSLSKFQSTTEGSIYSTELTGSDSNGLSYTGTLSLTNDAQDMFYGVLFTSRHMSLDLSEVRENIGLFYTSYIDTNNNLVLYSEQEAGPPFVGQALSLSCTPTSPDNLPSSVKAGDSGSL